MRARRKEQKDQELQWEEKVSKLDASNRQLASELESVRREAAELRSRLLYSQEQHYSVTVSTAMV